MTDGKMARLKMLRQVQNLHDIELLEGADPWGPWR
jgi:hypothetical protein